MLFQSNVPFYFEGHCVFARCMKSAKETKKEAGRKPLSQLCIVTFCSTSLYILLIMFLLRRKDRILAFTVHYQGNTILIHDN